MSQRDIDYFLFGFEQNRSACKKIFKVLKHSWCYKNPSLYLLYLNQYKARLFSDLYSSQVDFMNQYNYLPNLFDYVYNNESFPHFDDLNKNFFNSIKLKNNKHNKLREYRYDSELQK